MKMMMMMQKGDMKEELKGVTDHFFVGTSLQQQI